jgi:hypothetical protein
VTRQMQRFLLSSPVQSSPASQPTKAKAKHRRPSRAESRNRVPEMLCCFPFFILLAGEIESKHTPRSRREEKGKV